MPTASVLEPQGSSEGTSPAALPSAALPPGRRWVPAALFALAGLVLFALYLNQARTVLVSSDGAANMLQAWDMTHGNPLLRGWNPGDVSYYTTELPQYMLLELCFGLTGAVQPVAAAMTYTLLVLLAALLAKGSATGREGAVRALTAAGIMLAPSLGLGSQMLLANPNHLGTHVPLLATWLILDRARPRWQVPVIVAVLLTWVTVADPLGLYEGILPLTAICLIRAYRQGGPARERRYELSLAAGAILAAITATAVLTLIRLAGGFTAAPLAVTFASGAAMPRQIWSTTESVLVLFGADFLGLPAGASAAIALVHLTGLALAIWAAATALRRFGTQDRTVQVLTVTLAALLLSYLFTTRGHYAYNAHEIAGVLPIAAVLAGRLLAGPILRRRLAPLLAAVLACYALILIHDASQPPAVSKENQKIIAWLRARHLTYGLAGYWYASILTLDSGNHIQVRPIARTGQSLVLNPWEMQTTWYDSSQHDATFVIIPRSPGTCYTIGCLRQAPQEVFGPPAATYQVGNLLVLTWHKNLLDTRFHYIPTQVP